MHVSTYVNTVYVPSTHAIMLTQTKDLQTINKKLNDLLMPLTGRSDYHGQYGMTPPLAQTKGIYHRVSKVTLTKFKVHTRLMAITPRGTLVLHTVMSALMPTVGTPIWYKHVQGQKVLKGSTGVHVYIQAWHDFCLTSFICSNHGNFTRQINARVFSKVFALSVSSNLYY